KTIASTYEVQLTSTILTNAFTELVRKLREKHGRVVLLVDEYDKPLVDKLGDAIAFEENKAILRELYGLFKGLDEYLRFVLLTGVSRFARVNVFSGMNNLTDISLSERFANIVGFSQDELTTYFSTYLAQLQTKLQLPKATIETHIKDWYNGYSFDGTTRLYNPFSILSLYNALKFDNYWFTTGTPTFLIQLIKQQKLLPENFESMRTTDLVGSFSLNQKYATLPLLFQTGYLTISRIELDGVRSIYHLDYPNLEVKFSFLTYLLAGFTKRERAEIEPAVFNLKNALKDENIKLFVQILQSFLADIPARLHLPKEAYYHSLVYMILRLMGIQLLLEKETSKGRIDAVLALPDKVYILEFKFATNKRVKKVQTLANKAVQQIETQKYYEPYLGSGKKVILLGIGFLDKQLDSKVKIL
ncbi:MAG: AAA family ATPase, partial [Saprospiraceae bacterium]